MCVNVWVCLCVCVCVCLCGCVGGRVCGWVCMRACATVNQMPGGNRNIHQSHDLDHHIYEISVGCNNFCKYPRINL